MRNSQDQRSWAARQRGRKCTTHMRDRGRVGSGAAGGIGGMPLVLFAALTAASSWLFTSVWLCKSITPVAALYATTLRCTSGTKSLAGGLCSLSLMRILSVPAPSFSTGSVSLLSAGSSADVCELGAASCTRERDRTQDSQTGRPLKRAHGNRNGSKHFWSKRASNSEKILCREKRLHLLHSSSWSVITYSTSNHTSACSL